MEKLRFPSWKLNTIESEKCISAIVELRVPKVKIAGCVDWDLINFWNSRGKNYEMKMILFSFSQRQLCFRKCTRRFLYVFVTPVIASQPQDLAKALKEQGTPVVISGLFLWTHFPSFGTGRKLRTRNLHW